MGILDFTDTPTLTLVRSKGNPYIPKSPRIININTLTTCRLFEGQYESYYPNPSLGPLKLSDTNKHGIHILTLYNIVF